MRHHLSPKLTRQTGTSFPPFACPPGAICSAGRLFLPWPARYISPLGHQISAPSECHLMTPFGLSSPKCQSPCVYSVRCPSHSVCLPWVTSAAIRTSMTRGLLKTHVFSSCSDCSSKFYTHIIRPTAPYTPPLKCTSGTSASALS